jgi:hypothetical protein
VNRDFAEMLSALSEAGAEFLIVGAHALAAHGAPRATGDLDIWVRPTPANARRVTQALTAFGAPLHDLTLDDFTKSDTSSRSVCHPRVSPSCPASAACSSTTRGRDEWNWTWRERRCR